VTGTNYFLSKSPRICPARPGQVETQLQLIIIIIIKLLLRIPVIPGSNLDPDTGYPEGVRGFPQRLQANARLVS
jgi:hypothetical protein